jgi:hypothetical protein
MLPFAGMLDPDRMDPPERPFSYFANPNDLLGAWGAPVGSEVTPEGYVFTGFGELMFFTGNPPEPVHARIRTLHRGYLPIVESAIRFDIRGSFSRPISEGRSRVFRSTSRGCICIMNRQSIGLRFCLRPGGCAARRTRCTQPTGTTASGSASI